MRTKKKRPSRDGRQRVTTDKCTHRQRHGRMTRTRKKGSLQRVKPPTGGATIGGQNTALASSDHARKTGESRKWKHARSLVCRSMTELYLGHRGGPLI